MANVVTCDLRVLAEWLSQDTGGVVSTPNDKGEIRAEIHLANGDEANQIQKRWAAALEIAGGDDTTLDLQSLSYSQGGVSGTISFASVKAIVVRVTSQDAGIQIGGDGMDEWYAPWFSPGNGQHVGAGSPAVIANLVDGWAVSSGAKDLFLMNVDPDNAATFEILIVGN